MPILAFSTSSPFCPEPSAVRLMASLPQAPIWLNSRSMLSTRVTQLNSIWCNRKAHLQTFRGTCRMSHPRMHASEQFTIRKTNSEKWEIGQRFVASAETCTSRTKLDVIVGQEVGYLCSEHMSPETRKALGFCTTQDMATRPGVRTKTMQDADETKKSHLFTVLSNGLEWGAGHGINILIWCLGDYHVSSLCLNIHFSVYIFIIN